VEVQALVRATVDEAIGPLQRALQEAQRRAVDLEQRLAAASRAAETPPPAMPTPAAVQPTVARAAPTTSAASPYALPIVAPARTAVPIPSSIPPRAQTLDVAAIERMIPIDVDISRFDGRRRRRRIVTLFVLLIVAVFGGLGALLAQSYAPRHSLRESTSRSSLTVADLGGLRSQAARTAVA
jgi:hypothetical protein